MVIHMNMYQSLGFAIAWLLVGRFIKAKFEFFQKYCIPAPIVGGFLFALISLALHATKVLDFEFDTTLQTYWMVMFFTTVSTSYPSLTMVVYFLSNAKLIYTTFS